MTTTLGIGQDAVMHGAALRGQVRIVPQATDAPVCLLLSRPLDDLEVANRAVIEFDEPHLSTNSGTGSFLPLNLGSLGGSTDLDLGQFLVPLINLAQQFLDLTCPLGMFPSPKLG